MRAAKKLFPFLLFVVAVLAGYWTRPPSGMMNQSSLYDMEILSWDQISCLSPDENLKLYQVLHLKANVNPTDCTSQIDGRFNKTVAFLVKNQLNLPTNAFGDLTDLLRDPITFISENVPELDFDLKQDTSIAYNAMQRAVYLGGDFFRMDPYVSVAILLHEAWHSVKIDPGHEKCTTGDIAQTKGGCDQVFTLTGNMIGGYSVTFAYLAAHGLYSKILSPEKKKLLVDESLVLLSSRFNTGVQNYASVVESLVVLNKNHDLEIIHPLLGFKRVLSKADSAFRPQKISYNQTNGGVLIFTDDKRLFGWESFKPIHRYYGDIIDQDKRVLDSARMYLAVDDHTYTSVLLDNNAIYKVASGTGNAWSLVPVLEPNETAVQIATYHLYSAGFLGTDGFIYRIVQHGRGRGSPYRRDESFAKLDVRYKYITGGINSDTFWGVTTSGEVFYMIGNDFIQLTGVPSEPIQKVQVTHLGVYLLSESGKVYFAPKAGVGRMDFQEIPDLEGVVDFAVTKRLIPQHGSFEDLPVASTGCNGKPIASDPYFPGYYWVQDGSRLLFGDDKGCALVSDNIKTFHFSHSPTQDFGEYKAIVRRDRGAQEARIWMKFPSR